MSSLKLKRHETFYIREGWFQKAINTIKETDSNIFFKNNGVEYLGIGSNMVKSLKYWLRAANIIDGQDNNLSEFGELLYKYDRYLDDVFSWFFIHYFLTINKEDCPVFFEIMDSNYSAFDKETIVEYLYNRFLLIDKNVNKKYIEADVNIFLQSYVCESKYKDPEDNLICSLSRLKLFKKDKNNYISLRPSYSSLSYLIIYYALYCKYDGKAFNIEDSMTDSMTPVKIFNLDKYMYLQYLDDARNDGLITINRTAGLNTVYFEKELCLNDIFSEKFGGNK